MKASGFSQAEPREKAIVDARVEKKPFICAAKSENLSLAAQISACGKVVHGV
jgi:hypothetical protein